ncbi:MAG: DUF1684 domain-containing protein [Gemmatimonadales bacterium]|nr:MAG: DUF1684 domain-containing protein [Gemmatimonadales bacterium]
MRSPIRLVSSGLTALVLSVIATGIHAQGAAATLQRERGDLAAWLAEAPLSPFAAVALHPIGLGLMIGEPPADIPLPEFGNGTVAEENGLAILTVDGRRRALPRGRPIGIARYTLLVTGSRGRTTLAVFGAARGVKQPTYYTFREDLINSGALEPPEKSGAFPVLGLDGLETQAVEAGFFRLTVAGEAVRLRVYRLGESEDDEAAFFVFFQDATNGKGSYPGGRFVELLPESGGRFRLDFNRARNPFCAYSTVFPCPAPWPGNRLTVPVAAGEKYASKIPETR